MSRADRVAVETLRGQICAGPVVDRDIVIEDYRPVEYVSVEVTEWLTLTVPRDEAAAP